MELRWPAVKQVQVPHIRLYNQWQGPETSHRKADQVIQGVVTFIRLVEPFATGVKMKSSDQLQADYFSTKLNNQRILQRGNQTATFLLTYQEVKDISRV